MGRQQGLDQGHAQPRAEQVHQSPLVALGRLEGEAAIRIAAFAREVAIGLPGGSTFRSDLLDAVRELHAFAHSHGVQPAPARRS